MLSQTVHRWMGRPEAPIGPCRFLRFGSALRRETPSQTSWLLLDASMDRNHDKTVGMGYVVKIREIILACQSGKKSLCTVRPLVALFLAPGESRQSGPQTAGISQAESWQWRRDGRAYARGPLGNYWSYGESGSRTASWNIECSSNVNRCLNNGWALPGQHFQILT